MIAVADTGPLHYLALVGHADLPGCLVDRVHVPTAVADELAHPNAPPSVRRWIAEPPPWLSVALAEDADELDAALDAGERAVIAHSLRLRPGLVLMDDRAGAAAARAAGFVVTGTLGMLARGARRGLVDVPAAFETLDRTNFHWTAALRERLLADYQQRPVRTVMTR